MMGPPNVLRGTHECDLNPHPSVLWRPSQPHDDLPKIDCKLSNDA
jgi:hypothetical protein